MDERIVTLVHAVVPAMEAAAPYFAQLDALTVRHLLDESLLPEAERAGRVDDRAVDRLGGLVRLAVSAGSEAVVVTCNAYSGATAVVAARHPEVPVLSIDEVLVQEAVRRGGRIGVLGTVAVGLEQQLSLFREVAAWLGVETVLEPRLVVGAFDLLSSGERALHDLLVAEAAESLAGTADVIVLAQASMAPVREVILERGEVGVPVLASPQLMVERLRELLALEQ